MFTILKLKVNKLLQLIVFKIFFFCDETKRLIGIQSNSIVIKH